MPSRTVKYPVATSTRVDGDWQITRYHATDVVSVNVATGEIVLRNGGWFSTTTKHRINQFSPCQVWQDKGDWFVSIPVGYRVVDCKTDGKGRIRFVDGMRIIRETVADDKPISLPRCDMGPAISSRRFGDEPYEHETE